MTTLQGRAEQGGIDLPDLADHVLQTFTVPIPPRAPIPAGRRIRGRARRSADDVAEIACLVEELGRTRDPADLERLYALSSPRVFAWAKARMTTAAAEHVLVDIYTTIWRESAGRPTELDGWTWFLTRAGRAVREIGRS